MRCACTRHGGMGDSGIRDKTGEGLDGSGDGIRAGARRDENREGTGGGGGGGGDKMGDGVIWEEMESGIG